MTELFFSYSRENQVIVNEILKALEDLGFNGWIDTKKIKGGKRWSGQIAKAIAGCDFFLLFISSASIKSDGVLDEVDLAEKHRRNIIPILLENVEIPIDWDYQVAGLQWIEYERPDWLSRLLIALGNYDASSSSIQKKDEPDIPKVENPAPVNQLEKHTPIVAKIEHLYYNNRLTKEEKEALTVLMDKAVDRSMKEETMSPQEMNPTQVEELYQNSSYTVAHYMQSLAEYQPHLLNRIPGDPKTKYTVNILANMQQQILLVATVAEVHSQAQYEIYEFESQMILSSIRKLKKLLRDLDKYGGRSNDIPDNVQMQLDEEFDNLIFGAGRISLLMQELAQPKRKPFLQ